MKIIQRLKSSLILFLIIISVLFINIIPSLAADGNLKYYYDDLGRLINIENIISGKLLEYQYDEVGNRTQKGTYDSYFTITAMPVSNGSIFPAGTNPVPAGHTKTFSITPATGYVISDVIVDSLSVGPVETYVFPPVNSNHTISASFIAASGDVSIGSIYYPTLQAAYNAANNGDTIKVTAKTLLESLDVDRNISVNLEGGYNTSHTEITGETVLRGKVQTYSNGGTLTIKNFVLQRSVFYITATAGSNGSIAPGGTTNVSYGGDKTFNITPAEHYQVANVLVDGLSVGSVTSYTFNNVTADHTISASFGPMNYSITATAGSNGSISPAGTTNVTYGGSQAYTMTPNSGYIVQDVLVDNVSVGAVTSYTFNNVDTNHTISVSFIYSTKLLLHMDGTNGSTTFIDSSPGTKTITPHGNAQLSTAQKKFSTASGLFDGDSDWVTAPSSTDWSFGTGNFTIDFWLRKNTSFDSNYRGFCGQYVDSNNYWYFRYKPGILGIAFFYFKVVEGGVVKADYSTSGLSMSTNTWYHIELVRNGTAIYIFVNGVAQSITANTAISTKSMPAFSVLFDVGASHSNGLTFKGYLDEFRVLKGVAAHTTNFTPPTAPY